ncbi:hypothetical protein [Kutzneria sp. NPDC051319]|uniref:hypothetical protein n=1 Tax=Kutzneria sp. NPDC051319 TaxID=3155047 RepID=UPI0034329176
MLAAAGEVVVPADVETVDDVGLVVTADVVDDGAPLLDDGVSTGRAAPDDVVRVVVGVTDHCQSVGGCASATRTVVGELVARKMSTEQTSAPAVDAYTATVLPRRRSSRRDHSVKGSIARRSIRQCA